MVSFTNKSLFVRFYVFLFTLIHHRVHGIYLALTLNWIIENPFWCISGIFFYVKKKKDQVDTKVNKELPFSV